MVEIQVQLTSATLACQTALLDLINACIQELKRCTTAVRSSILRDVNVCTQAFRYAPLLYMKNEKILCF